MRDRRFVLATAVLGLAPLTAPASPTASDEPSPEQLEEAFETIEKMSSNRRKKLWKMCLEAAEQTGAPQFELVGAWADKLPRKLQKPTEFEAHDSRVYKGGPPRRIIGPKRNLWIELDAQLERRHPDPRPAVARPASYEFATGKLVEVEAAKKSRGSTGKSLPFRDLLEGRLPDQSVAEEALIGALDALAPMRKEASYFSHLYCDREANAYEGISLMDFWGTGLEVEVPDVDVRAYAKLVWDDESVPLPMTEADQDYWYPRIEKSLKDLRTYMYTTRALASAWFEGRPELSGGYSSSVDIMNAAIALCDSDASAVAAKLAEHGAEFLFAVREEIEAQGNAVWNAGNARRDECAAGKEAIRTAVLAVLAEQELL